MKKFDTKEGFIVMSEDEDAGTHEENVRTVGTADTAFFGIYERTVATLATGRMRGCSRIRIKAPRRSGKTKFLRAIAETQREHYDRIVVATPSTSSFHNNWSDMREYVTWVSHLKDGEARPISRNDRVLLLIDDINRIGEADLGVCCAIIQKHEPEMVQCISTLSMAESRALV